MHRGAECVCAPSTRPGSSSISAAVTGRECPELHTGTPRHVTVTLAVGRVALQRSPQSPTLRPHMLTDQELLGPLGGRPHLPRAFLVQTRAVTYSSTADPRGGPGRRGAGPVPPRPHSSRLTPPPVPCLLHTPGPQATLAGGLAWAGSPPRSSGQHHECPLRSPEARTCVPARCFSCTCQRWL